MSALVAFQRNPAIGEFYLRSVAAANKLIKLALVAFMRKLLTGLNTMVQTRAS